MKIRKGFVSNSSSTSFLIFSKQPLTREFVKQTIQEYPLNDSYMEDAQQDTLNDLDTAVEMIMDSHRYQKEEEQVWLLSSFLFDCIEDIAGKHSDGYNWNRRDSLKYKYYAMISEEDRNKILQNEKERDEVLKAKVWDHAKYTAALERTDDILLKYAEAILVELEKEYPVLTATSIGDDSNIGAYLEHSGVILKLGHVIAVSQH